MGKNNFIWEFEEKIQRALNYAYFFLKFRPRTKKEMLTYFTNKAKKTQLLDNEVIETTITQLEEEGLIDDRAFIAWLVEQRAKHKHKSERAIYYELLRFGLSKELINDYFETHPVDQESQARLALKKKWRTYQLLDQRRRFEKAANFLLRRGFPFVIAKKTIAEMEERE
ncbi:hypothetical protein A3F03_01295 [Candidatus Roizmanbacteria bacterium RIFCSPHIGHO2_12_FULL_41_11]|uniref:Regulatory protein RecX n=1 Tax=Candidatus Roizmanbacteria bacterium RIFCSPHIGHO2_12_FULL_41_11 TaxID=1802052 RepID=A0A1F7I2R5_9BACT|nr:MAG: hypothetical protein A3F03_01295 [Candidatus Roizmanbacteria bacterium RIFCSPHIGHO2_12_FULL_41_11]